MHQGRWDGTSEAYLNQAGWWGQAKLLQIKGRRGGPSEASINQGAMGLGGSGLGVSRRTNAGGRI